MKIFDRFVSSVMLQQVQIVEHAKAFFTKQQRKLQLGRKKQAELLNIFADLMAVGRLPYDIADYISKYGGRCEASIAMQIRENLGEGLPVTDAFQGWIDPMKLAALKVAEESGQEGFLLALRYVADELNSEESASSSSLAKSIMPFVYAVASLAFVIVLYYNFLPTLRDINKGILPKQIQEFESYASLMIHWGWAFLVVLAVLYIAFKYAEANLVGEIREQIELIRIGNWYPFGGYRLKVGAYVVSTFASLKKFDFPAFTIYKILSQYGTKYQKYHVEIMRNQLREGNENEIDSMDSGLLEDQYISLLKLYAGAEASSYVNALNAAARDIRQRCIRRININGQAIYFGLWMIVMYNLSMVVSVLMSNNVSSY